MKIIISFQSFCLLKLLITIFTLFAQKSDVKESTYGKKKLVEGKLDKESKFVYDNVKSNLSLIGFHHVLNVSLISNEKESEEIKFRQLSKPKNLIPNFIWALVTTSYHDPEKISFDFWSYELSSSDKDLLSKELRFTIPPKQIDYSNFMTEFELLYRNTLDLSMTTEEKDRFKTKLKDIALSSFRLFNENCEFENNLSAKEINPLKSLLINKNVKI